MDWAMRYTFHTGYEPPGMRPQFLATIGSPDPVAHVRHAAGQGVAGILYPWALDRPQEEVERVAAAIEDSDLCCSCIVSGDRSVLFTPLWTDRSASARTALADVTRRACRVAVSLRAGVLAAFVMSDRARHDDCGQRDDTVANLREMAIMAADHGLTIGIEPMMLPGLMFQSVGSALDVIGQVDRKNVGIIYDTAHVALMEGALLPAFRASYGHLVLLQLADLPGRVEPGAGELDLVEVAAEAIRRGYTGLVDLEHGWAAPTRDGEAAGLETLRHFDAALGAAARHQAADHAADHALAGI